MCVRQHAQYGRVGGCDENARRVMRVTTKCLLKLLERVTERANPPGRSLQIGGAGAASGPEAQRSRSRISAAPPRPPLGSLPAQTALRFFGHDLPTSAQRWPKAHLPAVWSAAQPLRIGVLPARWRSLPAAYVGRPEAQWQPAAPTGTRCRRPVHGAHLAHVHTRCERARPCARSKRNNL